MKCLPLIKDRQAMILQFLLQFWVQDFGDAVLVLAHQVVKFTTTNAHYTKSWKKEKKKESEIYFTTNTEIKIKAMSVFSKADYDTIVNFYDFLSLFPILVSVDFN